MSFFVPSASKQVGVSVSWSASACICITADPHRKSVSKTPAPNAIFPTTSQPFSIIWEDNTDSVVDLRRLLQYARNTGRLWDLHTGRLWDLRSAR